MTKTEKRLAIIRTRRTHVECTVSPQVLDGRSKVNLDLLRAHIATRRQLAYRTVSPQVISTVRAESITCSVNFEQVPLFGLGNRTVAPDGVRTCPKQLANDGKRVFRPCSCDICRETEKPADGLGGLTVNADEWKMADETHRPFFGPFLPFIVRARPTLSLAVVKAIGRATAPIGTEQPRKTKKGHSVTSVESMKGAREDRDFTLGIKYLPHGFKVNAMDLTHGKRQGLGTIGTRHVINENCLCLACLGGRIKMKLGRIDLGTVAPTTEEKVKDFVCGCNGGLVRRSYSKLPCKVCGQPIVKADSVIEEYAEIAKVKMGRVLGADSEKGTKQTKQRITCRALFCRDDKDSFSRSIAINYLAKRMVFSPKSNATGKKEPGQVTFRKADGVQVKERSKDGLGTLKSRKTSSNRHAMPMCMATDIEDIVNEAYLIHSTDGVHGGWLFRKTGNTLIDTVRACRMAHLQWQRAEFKRRQAIETVAYKADLEARGHTIGKMNERSRLTAALGKDFDSLVQVVEREGTAEQIVLAKSLGISQATVSRRLQGLRTMSEAHAARDESGRVLESMRKSYKRA